MNTTHTHALTFTEQIYAFDICGADFASSLICVATEKKLTLGLIRFPEETEFNSFEWDRLKDIYHESRSYAICFAPETSLVVLPKVVTFCSADTDFLLRIFRTDLQNSDTVQTLKGHSNYINDVAWDTEGIYLASVSDDQSCKIWSVHTQYENVITFCLSSAGMSVKWHPEEPQKLLVAEKKGIVHLYNVQSQQAIISLETIKCPLMSADWALNHRYSIAALAHGNIVTWDTRRSCAAPNVKQAHEDGGNMLRFSPSTTELITASIGRPDITLKVFTAKSNVPIVEAPLKLCGGLCWHHRLPYIGAASDRKLLFWKVQLK